MNPKWKSRLLKFWHEWCKPLAVVLIVLCSFRSAVADWNDVPTGSMKPTILEGDRIFVNKLAYDLKIPFTSWRLMTWGDPQRGDVVILFSPETGDRLVKRVIGIPGDQIATQNNRLSINGKPAAYGPLDADTIAQIETAARSKHRFARESFGGRGHPIMITPQARAMRTFGPVIVPPGEYFVMGDNRDGSKDSRMIGTVDRNAIEGRVPTVVLSLDLDNYYLPRWDRFFRSIP